MFFQTQRVKTNLISIIHYQQNIFVAGIYFPGEFTQAHVCISPEVNQHQRTPMKADRSHLHKGSPSLVKSPLTQHLNKPQTVPSALSSGHSCQGLLHCSGRCGRHDWHEPAGCICSCSAPSSILVLHLVLEERGRFASSGGYPRHECGCTQLSSVASNSCQNDCWGSNMAPSGELEFRPALSNH